MMGNDKTISEIQKGIWMVSPHMLYPYLLSAEELFSSIPTESNKKELQGGLVREVIDPDGNYINVNQDDVPMDSVGIVRCVGPMYKYGGWFYWGTDELLAFAQYFDNHPNIIGQIWQDDSGGGLISSVAPYLNFLENKKKPVVSLLDMCGSACYYKNCGTDYVMAENNISAMFGSIGVLIQFYDFAKMLKEMGIKEHIIESNLSKDKNKPFKLALEGKYDLIKEEMLDPAAKMFQDHVKAKRPSLNQDIPGILSGKMFYAEEALEHGMIDGIGNMQAAIERVKFLASARSFISITN
jgi:protease-4